jgi:hypothetical protein
MILFCFFLSHLDKLGFEEPKTVNGVDFVTTCGVGAIVCLNLLKESESCIHFHPLNLSAPLLLIPPMVLKFHILLETITTS